MRNYEKGYYIIIVLCRVFGRIGRTWVAVSGQHCRLDSGEEYLGDDFDKPTTLTIMLESGDDIEIALLGLQGDFALYKFRESQQYIITDFNGERTKWEIKNVEIDGKFLKYIYVVDATKFIDKLCECDFFAITLPLAIYGTTTFYFDTNGYPLDW